MVHRDRDIGMKYFPFFSFKYLFTLSMRILPWCRVSCKTYTKHNLITGHLIRIGTTIVVYRMNLSIIAIWQYVKDGWRIIEKYVTFLIQYQYLFFFSQMMIKNVIVIDHFSTSPKANQWINLPSAWY